MHFSSDSKYTYFGITVSIKTHSVKKKMIMKDTALFLYYILMDFNLLKFL